MFRIEKEKKIKDASNLSTSPNLRSSIELPSAGKKIVDEYPIIGETYLKADFSNGVSPLRFQHIIQPDIYIHHVDLEELVWHTLGTNDGHSLGNYNSGTWTHKQVTIIFTNTHYYILNRDMNSGLESKKDLREIQSVEALSETCAIHNITSLDMDQKLTGIKLVCQSPVSKNKIKSTEMESFLHERIFIADNEDNRDLIIILIRSLLRRFWQGNFESIYMPGLEIYQHHRFVTKANKKGRKQIRCFALSSEKLYNLQAPGNYPMIPGKIKWSSKIGTLHGVQSSEPKMLIIKADLPRGNTDVTLIFKDEFEKIEFLNELRRLYQQQTKTILPELKILQKPARSVK